MKHHILLSNILIFVICAVTSFGMAGCSSDNLTQNAEIPETKDSKALNPYQDKSVLEIADNRIGVVLTADVQSVQDIKLLIKNNTQKYISFGDMYSIEYKNDNDWYTVPLLPDTYFPLMLYAIEPGNERSYEVKTVQTHGELPAGHYRIIKEVNMTDDMDDDTDISNADKYNFAAEFDLKN